MPKSKNNIRRRKKIAHHGRLASLLKNNKITFIDQLGDIEADLMAAAAVVRIPNEHLNENLNEWLATNIELYVWRLKLLKCIFLNEPTPAHIPEPVLLAERARYRFLLKGMDTE